MDAVALFEHWLVSRENAIEPLSRAAAKPYASIWRSWCAWLAQQQTHYLQASAAQLSAFLQSGPTPRAARRPRAQLSEITQRRYWRVIQNLYNHAIAQGLTDLNPANLIAPVDKPPPEQPTSVIYTPAQWKTIFLSLPSAAGGSTWEQRDRTMLMLLMDSGITSSELCGLNREQVAPSFLKPDLTALHLSGRRGAQTREIELSAATAAQLASWTQRRAELTAHPLVKGMPLFLTEQRRRFNARALFSIVANITAAAFKAQGLPMPDHMGPQALRNTRIAQWLNTGVPLATVLARAGLKDVHSLRALVPHLNERVREDLASQTPKTTPPGFARPRRISP